MGVFVKIYTPHQEWEEGVKDSFSHFQCQVQEIPANSTSVNSQGGKCHLRRRRVVIKFDVRSFECWFFLHNGRRLMYAKFSSIYLGLPLCCALYAPKEN